MSIIRVFRDGTLVATDPNGPDTGTFNVPVATPGWSAGSPSITCTVEKSGYAESVPSVGSTLTVNAGLTVVNSTYTYIANSDPLVMPVSTNIAGDLLVVMVCGNNNDATPPAATLDATGFEPIVSYLVNNRPFQIWWKVSSGSEPANITATATERSGHQGIITTIRGQTTAGCPFGMVGTPDYSNVNEMVIPSITTSLANSLVGLFGMSGGGTFRVDVQSGVTTVEQVDQSGAYLITGSQAAAGPTGNTVFRWSDYPNSHSHVALLAEIIKAGAGTSVSDNFANGSNWTENHVNTVLPSFSGNKAVPVQDSGNRGVWAGTSLGANYTVQARVSVGTTAAVSRTTSLDARGVADDPLTFIRSSLIWSGTAFSLEAKASVGGVETAATGNSSPAGLASVLWLRLDVRGTFARWAWAPDNSGTPGAWAVSHTLDLSGSPSSMPSSGAPALSLAGGTYGANDWISNFSAKAV